MSENLVPCRMNLLLYKSQILTARKGHSLLKRKCDALKMRFKYTMLGLLNKYKSIDVDAQDTILLLAEAHQTGGLINQTVIDAVDRATLKLEITIENIVGVRLLQVNARENDEQGLNLSLKDHHNSQTILKCKNRFKDYLMVLVEIASLQTNFLNLDKVITETERKVNTLENIVIPRSMLAMKYIYDELEEMEKDDCFKIKKLLDNKRKMIEEENYEKGKLQLEVDDMNWQERENYDIFMSQQQPSQETTFY